MKAVLLLVLTLLSISGVVGAEAEPRIAAAELSAPDHSAVLDTRGIDVQRAPIQLAVPSPGSRHVAQRGAGDLPTFDTPNPHAAGGTTAGALPCPLPRLPGGARSSAAAFHDGELARNGATSSFATSIPPPPLA